MKKYICVDGNTAAAKIAYQMTEVAAIYPITPSSTMAELIDEWSCQERKNIFNQKVLVKQMQSEAGAAGAVHGSLVCGALSSTFTASQGLLLMIPNMYKIAGELLPAVFHVSARALATHALSIFNDHSDVMSVRNTGFNMLVSSNVQECQDLALVSHLSAIDSSLPFLHFFDGFRTSHEVQKIEEIDETNIKDLVNWNNVENFKNRALNPKSPKQMGTAQNPDIYFQNREASNSYYDKVYDIVSDNMKKVEKITGRKYSPFEYYGDKQATDVIVAMGSGTDTIKETIDYLNNNGYKVGLLKVVLYRPFNSKAFVETLPKTVKNLTVLDKTKECGSSGEPLYLDVVSSLFEQKININILGGRYGLGGKEFTPAQVKAVYDNAIDELKNHFTIGINDDVTNKSLNVKEELELTNNNEEYKFFGLGSDGTVSANKNTIKIIGNATNKYTQGYFEYDSKKSGSLTISHLRVSNSPILSAYTLTSPSFVAIHNFSFINRYDLLKDIKNNGTLLINTVLDGNALNKFLPLEFKKQIIDKNLKVYTINAQEIAKELGLGNKINVIMQSAFFKISNVIDYDLAKKEMESAIIKTYSKKGENVVNANIKAIEYGSKQIVKIDNQNFTLDVNNSNEIKSNNDYYTNYIKIIDELKGNDLPVSKFSPDGAVPTDTTKYQKRGIAEYCPSWIKEECIQCGMCAMACPHACLRGTLASKETLKDKPSTFETVPAMAKPNLEYRMQLSPLDCTGCGVCASVCPVKNKALKMVLASDILEKEKNNFEYSEKIQNEKNVYPNNTVKSLQFRKPYFEYNYACAGCGETPYIKLLTQLFGDSMIIANATGCSSIYGGSAPTCPYAKDENGNGPAWANSLFEDNAEFGLGMSYALKNEKEQLILLVQKYLEENISDNTRNLLNEWLNNKECKTEKAQEIIISIKNENDSPLKSQLLKQEKNFASKYVWVIGGDGWAYDIGYGGLDHLLSSNENVKVLVLDSEVYSNTGGQSSKSTPQGAMAKFAANGKQVKKKNLAAIAMANNNAYVAQISIGANPAQAIKAFNEANSFEGPSIIIAYSPCINHGFNMSNSNLEMKKAVECGYWNIFRYNPNNEEKLTIDYMPNLEKYEEYLVGETRYSALSKKNPEQAKILFEQNKTDAKNRLETLLKFKN